jgi:hypothetical protein
MSRQPKPPDAWSNNTIEFQEEREPDEIGCPELPEFDSTIFPEEPSS